MCKIQIETEQYKNLSNPLSQPGLKPNTHGDKHNVLLQMISQEFYQNTVYLIMCKTVMMNMTKDKVMEGFK